MRALVWFGGVGLAAVLIAAEWPLTAALEPGDAVRGRIAAGLLSCLACLGLGLARNSLPGGPRLWTSLAIIAIAAGVGTLVASYNATGTCIADYEGQPRMVGRVLQPWVHPEPGATASSLLFDAAGRAEMAWTAESIRRCRWMVGWVGLSAIPMFSLAACFLVQAGRRRLLAPGAARPVPSDRRPGACRFDAFFSYRHGEPDRSFALELLNRLEERGFRCAIDERDFAPNQHFLTEMERCVKESRFVLCVITARYVASGHCVEEAVLGKTMDMSERTFRVVPLIFERVELPLWLHGIVGVDFTEDAGIDPVERVAGVLRPRASGA